MALEFVDRKKVLEQLVKQIQMASSKRRVILLDSPAGMGKTRLLIEVCREIIRHVHEREVPWKIIRLDFRDDYPRPLNSRGDIIREIARQICRDISWHSIRDLVARAQPEDQIWLQQVALIPMQDETRKALLRAVCNVPHEDLEKIRRLLVHAFDDIDIEQLKETRHEPDVADLVGFILNTKAAHHGDAEKQYRIPNHILLVIDGLDALRDDLRDWVINELAFGLAFQFDGLQRAFERFVVIVSGRFIGQTVDSARKHHFKETVLESFEDLIEDVEDLLGQFKDEVFNDTDMLVSRLARKLSQISGGHPKVIKETATKLFEQHNCFSALIMDPLGTGYWYNDPNFQHFLTELRNTTIDDIVDKTSQRQQRLLELLSVFRQFNSATLAFLSSRITEYQNPPRFLRPYVDCLQDDISEETSDKEKAERLYTSLLRTRLIWNGGLEPFGSDRFGLRLMAARMQDQQPDLFRQLNEWALELFEDWAKGRFCDDPNALSPVIGGHQRICVCEWLFHRLHLIAPCAGAEAAIRVGKEISQELRHLLEYVEPFPNEEKPRQLERIRNCIEQDRQIKHLIWEIAYEKEVIYDEIQDRILQSFT